MRGRAKRLTAGPAVVGLAAIVAGLGGWAWAGWAQDAPEGGPPGPPPGKLVEFEDGKVAFARDVNHNFRFLLSEIEALKGRLDEAKERHPPVGSIVAFGGPRESIPAGWRPCDGSVLPADRHPELARVLGAYWGVPKEREVVLPDLRGYFLRGVDHGAGRDPDIGARQPLGKRAPGEVGAWQAHALQDHSHTFQIADAVGGGGHTVGKTFPRNESPGSTSGARGAQLGSETRPLNVAVEWIIRVE